MDRDQRALPIYSGTIERPVDLLFYHTVRSAGGGVGGAVCSEPDLAYNNDDDDK